MRRRNEECQEGKWLCYSIVNLQASAPKVAEDKASSVTKPLQCVILAETFETEHPSLSIDGSVSHVSPVSHPLVSGYMRCRSLRLCHA